MAHRKVYSVVHSQLALDCMPAFVAGTTVCICAWCQPTCDLYVQAHSCECGVFVGTFASQALSSGAGHPSWAWYLVLPQYYKAYSARCMRRSFSRAAEYQMLLNKHGSHCATTTSWLWLHPVVGWYLWWLACTSTDWLKHCGLPHQIKQTVFSCAVLPVCIPVYVFVWQVLF